MLELEIRRLRSGDEQLAHNLFRVMTDVFEQNPAPLSPEYVTKLLSSAGFWVLAALDGDQIAGGITAHALPMTRSQEFELFIYDLAVPAEYQRKGIGRALMTTLLQAARAEGIQTAIVPVDPEDTHALDFYRAIGGTESAVQLFLFEG